MHQETIQALLSKATDLLDSGDLTEALRLYSEVLALDPDNYDACLMAGSIYGELGQLADAVKYLHAANELRPGETNTTLALAHVLRAQGNLPLAIDVLQNAARSRIDDEAFYCTLGSMQEEAAQFTQAADSFAQAVKISDMNKPAWLKLCALLHKTASNERLVVACQRALEFEPGNIEVTEWLGDALIALGRFAEAERVLVPIAERHPERGQLLSKTAISLSRQGRHGEALEYSARAMRTQPDSDLLQAQHCDILEKHGDNEEAFDLIKPLLESERPPVWAALAFAKLSPVFDTRDDCRYLLGKISERYNLNDKEREAINAARAFLDQKEYGA